MTHRDADAPHRAPSATGPSDWAYVAMGSNLGDPLRQMRSALGALESLGRVRVRSSLYATEPVGGPTKQPPYLNAVVALEPNACDPLQLLTRLLGIERELGRERRERWGPRVIDLDLLAFGAAVRHVEAGEGAQGDATADGPPGLALPHPRMTERAFVLVPLCEVSTLSRRYGEPWAHPLTGQPPCEMLAQLHDQHAVTSTDLTWIR